MEERENKTVVTRAGQCLLCLLLALVAAPAFAQISYATNGQQKKQQKQFLKEAEKTESVYKDTHLNTDVYTFKKGEAARKRIKAKNGRAGYTFDANGKPVKTKKAFRKQKAKRQKKKRAY